MAYMLGLDIGTSGVKALLVEDSGVIVGSALQEYPFYSPHPGWTEQDPQDMWQGTIAALAKVLAKFNVDPKEIKGVGLSGQMHSSVFLDNNGQVIRPAILWNDGRTTKQCRDIEALVGKDLLLAEACNPALQGFTAPKVLWLRENEPENFAKVRWLVLPKDYIRYRLTGQINMEISDAAGTLLLNVKQRTWSQRIMDKLNLPMEILPSLVNSAQIAGEITAEVAKLTGLVEGTPVVGGGADNACGAVGSGIVKAGRAMISLGTSGVMLAHLDTPTLPTGGTIHMFNHAVTDKFYMMGVLLSAGLSYRWFRDELGQMEQVVGNQLDEDAYTLLTKQASLSSPGSNGLLFLPYLTGERTPHADGNARASFFGLGANHTRKDMIRSILEGVGFGFQDSLQLLRQAGWEGSAVRCIGGGSKAILWREIIASMLDLQVQTLNSDEGPGLGAALLAGVGTGMFSDPTEASGAILQVTSTVDPNPEWQTIYQDLYPIYQGLYPALKTSFEQLAKIAPTLCV